MGNLVSKKKVFSRVRIPINTFYATSKSLNAALAKNVIKILSMVETVSHYFQHILKYEHKIACVQILQMLTVTPCMHIILHIKRKALFSYSVYVRFIASYMVCFIMHLHIENCGWFHSSTNQVHISKNEFLRVMTCY